MRTILTNNENDIHLDNYGNIAIGTGIEAVQNVALNNVRTIYGEVPLNTKIGIPYFSTVFTPKPNIELFRQFITEEILKIENVTGISDFFTSIKNGVLTYSLTIHTADGEEVPLNV